MTASQPSYILPYTMIGATVGGTLSYLTKSPVYLAISLPIGAACGMIKDANVKNNITSSNASAATKIATIYVLGPPLLLITCCVGIGLYFKS